MKLPLMKPVWSECISEDIIDSIFWPIAFAKILWLTFKRVSGCQVDGLYQTNNATLLRYWKLFFGKSFIMWIAAIGIEPPVKYSFGQKGTQTRQKGQYKAELTPSPRFYVKPLITVVRAIKEMYAN